MTSASVCLWAIRKSRTSRSQQDRARHVCFPWQRTPPLSALLRRSATPTSSSDHSLGDTVSAGGHDTLGTGDSHAKSSSELRLIAEQANAARYGSSSKANTEVVAHRAPTARKRTRAADAHAKSVAGSNDCEPIEEAPGRQSKRSTRAAKPSSRPPLSNPS
jgi:hypothetical protein